MMALWKARGGKVLITSLILDDGIVEGKGGVKFK